MFSSLSVYLSLCCLLGVISQFNKRQSDDCQSAWGVDEFQYCRKTAKNKRHAAQIWLKMRVGGKEQMPSWPEMTRRNEIFAMLQLALMKTLQFPMPIRECKMKTPATTTATSDASDSCTRQALLYLALHVRSCQSLTVAHSRMPGRRCSEPRRTCEMFIIWRKILGTLLTFHRISSLSRFTKSSWLCLCDWQTNGGQRVACQRVSFPPPRTPRNFLPVYLLALQWPRAVGRYTASRRRWGGKARGWGSSCCAQRLAVVVQAATGHGKCINQFDSSQFDSNLRRTLLRTHSR